MAAHIHEIDEAVARSAERQMRMWATSLEVRQRVDQERAETELQQQIHPYVAVSRESGTDATKVAALVAETLGCDFLDRELLNCMAESYNWPDDMLEFVDEAGRQWVAELFRRWLGQRLVTSTEYAMRLGHLLLMATRHKSVVIVGRGGQFYLPREKGLLVRVIAPREQRILHTMQVLGLEELQAAEHVDRTDLERREFIQQHFHRDANDPLLYDLVINMHYCDLPDAAEMIVSHFRRRFGTPLPRRPK